MDNFGQSIMSLKTYSVGASCSHAAVMYWIVSDSFPHLLHSSSVSGCFKIYFLLFLVSVTLSCIAVLILILLLLLLLIIIIIIAVSWNDSFHAFMRILMHFIKHNTYVKHFFPPVALRPNAGHGLLIHEVSRSHTTTHHSR